MKTSQERKAASEAYIRSQGIGVFDGLPYCPDASQVRLKSFDAICRRAVAALIMTQYVFELGKEKPDNITFFVGLLKRYGVEDALNAKERKLYSMQFKQQDAVDVIWEYECYWSLVWALGLIDNIRNAGETCDCDKAIHLVADCKDMEAFKAQCHLRSIDEILDMLDLYYRYHWACVQKRAIDPNLPTGNLNEEVVWERRRGLEWLISEEDDWHEIALHT
ncbi:MAG: DUF4272 domain-containing protein [Oscillospiraceae bacterium]|nr:DUF4272 domain-containing protein [Oscillospiraceae bacterium]